MMLAHLGVGVFIFGVTMVKTYEVERDADMSVDESAEIAGYVFTFKGVREVKGPNYDAVEGLVILSRDGRELAQLRPQKRMYRVQSNPMTEADIRSRITGDIYVSLGQASKGDAWVVRLYYKPFVTWIWGGCVLMALGGALAAADRRYRVARREQVVPAAGTAGASA
jgi:cytochrome c-type biogenesis protein CcmF